jgi:hypothetical protein
MRRSVVQRLPLQLVFPARGVTNDVIRIFLWPTLFYNDLDRQSRFYISLIDRMLWNMTRLSSTRHLKFLCCVK